MSSSSSTSSSQSVLESQEADLQRMLAAPATSSQRGSTTKTPIKMPPPLASMTLQERKKYDALNPRPTFEEVHNLPVRQLILEGLLAKKSPGSLFTVYQERYFVLHSDKLEYYKLKEDYKENRAPQGIIPLYAVKTCFSCAQTKGKPKRFDVVVSDAQIGRTFELQAASPYEAETWVTNIKAALKMLDATSSGLGVRPTHTQTKSDSDPEGKKFWKRTTDIEHVLQATPLTPSQAAQDSAPPSARPSASMNSAPGAPQSMMKTQKEIKAEMDAREQEDNLEKAMAAAIKANAMQSPSNKEKSKASVSTNQPILLSPTSAGKNSVDVVSTMPIQLQLVKPMSKGPIGSVYLAKQTQTENFFLVHVVRKGSPVPGTGGEDTSENIDTVKAMLLFESMGKLNHPSLPSQVFAGTALDALWVVYLPAFRVHDSLLHALTQHRRLPEEIVCVLSAQLVCLLGYLHGQGYIARSLSPDTVYLDSSGRLVLLDFFLTLPHQSGRRAMEEESIVPEYLTPELAAGGEETRAADWWRLGVSERDTSLRARLCIRSTFQLAVFCRCLLPLSDPDVRARRRHPSPPQYHDVLSQGKEL
jgi:hypothetical protein